MASVLRRLVWRGHSPRCASRSQTEPADGGAPVICAADGPQSRPHKENPAACGVTAAGGIPRSVPPPKDGGPQWPPAPRTSATRSAQACASPASTRSPKYYLANDIPHFPERYMPRVHVPIRNRSIPLALSTAAALLYPPTPPPPHASGNRIRRIKGSPVRQTPPRTSLKNPSQKACIERKDRKTHEQKTPRKQKM